MRNNLIKEAFFESIWEPKSRGKKVFFRPSSLRRDFQFHSLSVFYHKYIDFLQKLALG